MQMGLEILYFFRRKTVSADHRYAFCRAKQVVFILFAQTQKYVVNVKTFQGYNVRSLS